jgi:hypothetical protein
MENIDKSILNKERMQTRKNFIEAATKLIQPSLDLLLAWEKLNHEDNGETSVDNPFQMSFDEFFADYTNWVYALEEKFLTKIDNFEPTLTVGELKKVLSTLSDDTQIVVDDEKNDWWLNIGSLDLPDEDEGMFTLTIHTSDNFDPRQF